jgi:IclR family transcriptional regulator, acetate operon repressor
MPEAVVPPNERTMSLPDGVAEGGRTQTAPVAATNGGALSRALRILETLIQPVAPMSTAAIAQACGFDTSTTHRLLRTLVKDGYVLKFEDTKRYLASPKGLLPLSLYHPLNIVRRDVASTLMSLRNELGMTAGIVLFCNGERLVLDLAAGSDSLSPYYETWLKGHLHCSASGKVLLMSLSVEERRHLLGPEPYASPTPQTITDWETLEADLEASRPRGYVIARDDAFVGMAVLGAPVVATGNVVLGCLFLACRSSSLDDDNTKRAGLALKQAADLISHGTPSLNAVSNMFPKNPNKSRSGLIDMED